MNLPREDRCANGGNRWLSVEGQTRQPVCNLLQLSWRRSCELENDWQLGDMVRNKILRKVGLNSITLTQRKDTALLLTGIPRDIYRTRDFTRLFGLSGKSSLNLPWSGRLLFLDWYCFLCSNYIEILYGGTGQKSPDYRASDPEGTLKHRIKIAHNTRWDPL